MKSQIVPVILFCLVFPWIVARVFQIEDHPKTLQESPNEWFRQETASGCDKKAEVQRVSYDELSNKQINYLIP